MATPDFDVGVTEVCQHMGSQDYSDWSDRFEEWLEQAYATLNLRLKQQGYSAVDAAGQGAESDVYRLCKRYLTLRIAADAVRSTARDDGTQARSLKSEAADVLLSIEDAIESVLGDAYDPSDHRATPRWQRRKGGSRRAAKHASRFWSRGRGI